MRLYCTVSMRSFLFGQSSYTKKFGNSGKNNAYHQESQAQMPLSRQSLFYEYLYRFCLAFCLRRCKTAACFLPDILPVIRRRLYRKKYTDILIQFCIITKVALQRCYRKRDSRIFLLSRSVLVVPKTTPGSAGGKIIASSEE